MATPPGTPLIGQPQPPVLAVQPAGAGNVGASSEMGPRKKAAYHLVDAALLIANISQLRTVLDSGSSHPYYILLLTCIGLSITVQMLFAVIIIVIWSQKQFDKYKQKIVAQGKPEPKSFWDVTERKAQFLDRLSVFLVLMIIVLNMFVCGFGLRGPSEFTPGSVQPETVIPPTTPTPQA